MSSIKIWLFAIIGLVGIIFLHNITYEAHAVELEDYEIVGDVVFDGNIRLMMQDEVENAHEVPLVVTLPRYLHDMKDYVLIVDNNSASYAYRATQTHRKDWN